MTTQQTQTPTPRTDAVAERQYGLHTGKVTEIVTADFTRQLEREVDALKAQLRQRDDQLKAANEDAETLATQLYSLMLDGENIGVDSKLNNVIHHANRDDADLALEAHRARTGGK